ncbi:hypothetical protein BDR05DRAFT_954629 [Suillus weaverae]|nr:hypothetical protein BDR05DRAFT_954629 [Suillus weaverae]
MVKTLSHDGAFPVGDSAHVVPRAGGQGLNSGIQYGADSGVEISPSYKTHLQNASHPYLC